MPPVSAPTQVAADPFASSPAPAPIPEPAPAPASMAPARRGSDFSVFDDIMPDPAPVPLAVPAATSSEQPNIYQQQTGQPGQQHPQYQQQQMPQYQQQQHPLLHVLKSQRNQFCLVALHLLYPHKFQFQFLTYLLYHRLT
jgi:hypothetical protein